MPDLQPVFDELRRRLSEHQDAFRATADLTDANAAGGRKLCRRMQGKSCFNFTRVDPVLFDELAALSSRGREAYERAGLLAR